MKSIKDTLRGIIPPVLTPFDVQEEIDEQLFRAELRFFINTGIHDISIGGSMGEGYTLSPEELYRLIKIGIEETQGKVPIVAGVIRDSTRDAIKSARAAQDAGASYLMIAPIHYFQPNDEAIFAYYSEISKAVDLPIIVYNVVPTAVVTPQCLQRLATIDKVLGVKQSAGDIHKLNDILKMLPEDFAVYSAVDDLLYPTFTMGAIGSISAINTVLPEICLELWNAYLQRDEKRALELHYQILPVFHAMQGTNMPAKTKEFLNQRGINVGVARRPMHPISDEEKAEISKALASVNLLKTT